MNENILKFIFLFLLGSLDLISLQNVTDNKKKKKKKQRANQREKGAGTNDEPGGDCNNEPKGSEAGDKRDSSPVAKSAALIDDSGGYRVL